MIKIKNAMILLGIALIILISAFVIANKNNELEGKCRIVSAEGKQIYGITAKCNSNEVVTGGGWADSNYWFGNEDDQDASYPLEDKSGWYCKQNSANEAECYAVCCDKNLIETEIKQETKQEGSPVSVLCDSGFGVGGGFLDLSNINDDYDNNSPLADLLGWRCAEDNSGVGSKCYSVCAEEKEGYDLSCYREEKIGNQESGVFAECDEGYTLLGGGFNAVEDSGGNNDDQDYNKPVDNSWYCKEDNSGQDSRCYATCCKLTSAEGCVPETEVCNELDDDCDGQIDEGLNCDVTCFQNSDCGEATEELMCVGNNVKKKITTPVCVDSSCNASVTFELVKECDNDEECDNGKCVEEKDDDNKKSSTKPKIEYCGDTICDEELGEDKFTCPFDCKKKKTIGTASMGQFEEGILELNDKVVGKKETNKAVLGVWLALVFLLVLLIIIIYFLKR